MFLRCYYSNFTLVLVGIILLGLCMFKKKVKTFVDKFMTRERGRIQNFNHTYDEKFL